MGEKAIIHIEIDKEKKAITDFRISNHLNPVAAAIVMNQMAIQVLAPVKIKQSPIIQPKIKTPDLTNIQGGK